jgi:nucleotide-binding universal stress UspA family protein
MFQRLLICTDLADGLQRLVDFVPSLAAGGVQHVTFLHVIPLNGRSVPHIDEAKVKQAQTQLTVTAPPEIEVKVEVQSGQVTERILATATAHQAEVIVLGTESRNLLTEKLFGSTATALCHTSQKPVLILRPQLISTYTVAELDLRCRHLFRFLLIPYDGSKASEYLLAQIQQAAQQDSARALQECLLLWAVEENDRINRLLHENRVQEAETKLAVAKAALEAFPLTVTTKVVTGEAIPETLKAALDYDITAIAVASTRYGKLTEWSSPSFTGELLRRSWHPVLFFPMPNH